MRKERIYVSLLLYFIVVCVFLLPSFFLSTKLNFNPIDVMFEVLILLLTLTLFTLFQLYRGSLHVYRLCSIGFALISLSSAIDLMDEFYSFEMIDEGILNDLIDLAGYSFLVAGAFRYLNDSFTLISKLNNDAHIDHLTGVNNRSSIEELLHESYRSSLANGSCFSIMMLDLDHFKRVNDTFGHPVGDLTLQKVSKTIHSQLRTSDSLGRYGGEEFMVILPGIDIQHVLVIAERVRESVAALVDSEIPSMTVSIGVAQCDPSKMSVKEAVLAADQALYKAKADGRNRVVAST